jgi:alpha-galactosidase/6-phospho-beta-glucosidase family protein
VRSRLCIGELQEFDLSPFLTAADLPAIYLRLAIGEPARVVDTPHNGAGPDWPTDWALEMPCRVDRGAIHPLLAEPLPLFCFPLPAEMKTCELHNRSSYVWRSEGQVLALLAHPLSPSANQVRIVLDIMLETDRAYLPRFFQ